MSDEPRSDQRPEPLNIVLAGFMGTGKSTVGRILAHRLRFDFVDTDKVIEREHGPIPEIFGRVGEVGFRQLERELALELAGSRRTVIATGGGMLLDSVNAEALASTGIIFCLTANIDEIMKRLGTKSARLRRPMLDADDPRARVEELLTERSAAYAGFRQVRTNGMTPSQVANLLAVRVATVTQQERVAASDSEQR